MTQFSLRPLKNFTQIFSEKTPQLSLLRAVNKTATEIAVAYLIVKLCKRINVVRNMSADQISECAKTIVTDYWQLTYDDIALALDMGYKNQLSDDRLAIFDRMDECIILRWLLAYDVIRTQKLREKQDEVNVYQVVASDPVYQSLKQVADKLSIKEVIEPIKFERKQDLGQLFLSEWDKLQLKDIGGIKVKMYKDHEFFDVNDYLSARLMEVCDELKQDQHKKM